MAEERRPTPEKGLPDLGRVIEKIEGLKEVSHIKEAVLEPKRETGTMGFTLTGVMREEDISGEGLKPKVNKLLEKVSSRAKKKKRIRIKSE